MNAIAHLLALAAAYASATGAAESTISWRVFGDTKKLGAIRAGADIQTTRFERAVIWFSNNWPDDAVWPDEVPRPPAPASSAPADAVAAP